MRDDQRNEVSKQLKAGKDNLSPGVEIRKKSPSKPKGETFNLFDYNIEAPPESESKTSNSQDREQIDVRYIYPNTEQALDELVNLADSAVLAIDTETTGLDPITDRVRLVQLGVPGKPVLLLDMDTITSVSGPLNELLGSEKTLKLFHNAKFDIEFLKIAGIDVKGPLFDTMLAELLLTSGLAGTSAKLSDMSKKYLNVELPKEQQLSDWTGTLTQEQLEYAARDVAVLLELYTPLSIAIEESGLSRVAELEFEALPAVVALELNGIFLDTRRLEKLTAVLQSELEESVMECRELLDAGINLDSPKQLLRALSAKGIRVDNTSASTLEKLRNRHPEVAAILRYRRASKAISTFSNKLTDHIHPVSGRIHPSYWQIGASTGRFSCSNPNLQQIPKEARFRDCFVPAPGNKFVIADYSQIELRVAAAISRDPVMIKAYKNNEDLHRETAAVLIGKKPSEITKEERQLAKAVNFGLLFAMGARGLSNYAESGYGVKMSVKEAQEFIERFFNHYTGLKYLKRRVGLSSQHEVRTLSGRRYLLSEDTGLSVKLNIPVQGTAADLLKIALGRLPRALEDTGAMIVAIVHDEIILEVPESAAEKAKRILVEVMEGAGDGLMDVPLVAEATIADSWAGKA